MNKLLVSEIENHIGTDIDSLLPAEFLLDETHPNNQSFFQTLKKIDAEVRGLTYGLNGKEIQTSIMAYRGDTPKEIASALRVNIQTVYKWRKKEVFKKLIALYAYPRTVFSHTNPSHERKPALGTRQQEQKNKPFSICGSGARAQQHGNDTP